MALTARLLDILARMPKADLRASLCPLPCPGPADLSPEPAPLPSWEAGSEPGQAPPLHRAEDLGAAAMAYFRAARENAILRSELIFDPRPRAGRPAELAAAFEGLFAAMSQAREELGMSSGLILCFSRYPAGSPVSLSAALERCLPYLDRVAAIELDASDPAALEFIPPALQRAMSRRDGSAPRLIALAGPAGAPRDILRAVESLGADRIHRAGRAPEDPRLFERLLADRIPITLCPIAESALPDIGAIERHPLPALLRSGALAAVASDQPIKGPGYLTDNLISAFDALPLSEADAKSLCLNGFEASLMPPDEKRLALLAARAFFDALPPP